MFKFLEKLVDHIFNAEPGQLWLLGMICLGVVGIAGLVVLECLKLFV